MSSRQRFSSPGKKTPRINLARDSSGLSMLEVIMAFVILQIAIVAFAQFFTAGLDISRSVRRTEMAQLLGQAKMEELIRAIPARKDLDFSGDVIGSGPRLLNERPDTFEAFASANPEDVTPFAWIAEMVPSPKNSKLVNLTLHIYSIRKRMKEGDSNKEDFYLSDSRKTFTLVHTLADGSVELVSGRENLRLSSAVALP